MNKHVLTLAGTAGCLLGAALLITLTGCVDEGYVGYSGYVGYVGPDDFVYYPAYELYYGRRSHEWYYRDHDRWVPHSAPRDVPPDRLRSAPSVPMNFHDNPGAHQAEVSKQYPRNWTPPSRDHGQDQDHGRGHGQDQDHGRGHDKDRDNR